MGKRKKEKEKETERENVTLAETELQTDDERAKDDIKNTSKKQRFSYKHLYSPPPNGNYPRCASSCGICEQTATAGIRIQQIRHEDRKWVYAVLVTLQEALKNSKGQGVNRLELFETLYRHFPQFGLDSQSVWKKSPRWTSALTTVLWGYHRLIDIDTNGIAKIVPENLDPFDPNIKDWDEELKRYRRYAAQTPQKSKPSKRSAPSQSTPSQSPKKRGRGNKALTYQNDPTDKTTETVTKTAEKAAPEKNLPPAPPETSTSRMEDDLEPYFERPRSGTPIEFFQSSKTLTEVIDKLRCHVCGKFDAMPEALKNPKSKSLFCRCEDKRNLAKEYYYKKLAEATAMATTECPNVGNGCMQNDITLSTVDEHLETCDFEEVTCPTENSCGETMLRQTVPVHVIEECPNRWVIGECGHQVQFRTFESHCQGCPFFKEKCQHCNLELQAAEINAHLKECPEITVPCSFKTIGCPAQLRRRELAEHYKTDGPEHARLFSKFQETAFAENSGEDVLPAPKRHRTGDSPQASQPGSPFLH
eukprot:TRINITY_DN4303_c0_g1_i1.p1 TRINITY_DN4303_c0_g1~~TRINITY_DN4303_c0_g1_i1.p1  ORF type:complete len:532 (+),score=70.38 TRINITY_DN4303_c0_g1_i1:100-1695(+)